MIQSVTVTNHLGESLTMELRSPEKSGFFIRGIDGLGPSKATVNITEILAADGGFFNSSRVGTRNIVMDIGFMDGGFDSIETIRQKTYKFFPPKKELTIEVVTDNRIGVTTGYVETNEPNIFSKMQTSMISIICPRSFFYGKEIIQTTFSGIDSAFSFPWENPSLTLSLIEFGQVYIDTVRSVFYTGDESTGVTIYVSFLGAVNDLSIHNATTGESMEISSDKLIELTGEDFQYGDHLIISTLRGNKYIHLIRDGLTVNILNTLDVLSDWFRIDRGDNVFLYTADSGLANMQFVIEHRIVYGGL